MATQNLIVLSYHQFYAEENLYPFSRTYKQFQNDLNTKDFDWITIDDGHASIIKACKMMEEKNFRAKIFISTALIGKEGYLTWDEVWTLSRHHDIENHSHQHIKLTEKTEKVIRYNINRANELIYQHTGRRPRYFVPPWNQFNPIVVKIAMDLGLQLVKDRTDIKNDSR